MREQRQVCLVCMDLSIGPRGHVVAHQRIATTLEAFLSFHWLDMSRGEATKYVHLCLRDRTANRAM